MQYIPHPVSPALSAVRATPPGEGNLAYSIGVKFPSYGGVVRTTLVVSDGVGYILHAATPPMFKSIK